MHHATFGHPDLDSLAIEQSRLDYARRHEHARCAHILGLDVLKHAVVFICRRARGPRCGAAIWGSLLNDLALIPVGFRWVRCAILLLLVNERVRVVVVVGCIHLHIHGCDTLRPRSELFGAVVAPGGRWLLLIVLLLCRLLLLLTVGVIVLHALHQVVHAPVVDVRSLVLTIKTDLAHLHQELLFGTYLVASQDSGQSPQRHSPYSGYCRPGIAVSVSGPPGTVGTARSRCPSF